MITVSFAANHREIGGGEVMLLAMAEATRESGRGVRVVAPAGELLAAAADRGFATVEIQAGSSVTYLAGLRRWATATRPELLWCTGLRPSLATSSLPHRVVHLHSLPSAPLRALLPLFTADADDVIVPSAWMREQLGPAVAILANWTRAMVFSPRLPPEDGSPIRLGFLGRLTSAKGAMVLADALTLLHRSSPGRFQLVVGGAARFTGGADAARVNAALAAVSPAPIHLGWVEPEELFRQVDLAVFPSVAPESFGLVAGEAMGSGCPFVTTDAGALPGVTAQDPRFVAHAGNPESLATAIDAATRHYTSDRLDASRQRWEELFSPEAGTLRFTEYLKAWEGRQP